MKVKKIKSGKDERQILTAMITDDVLLGKIAPIWKANDNLFDSKFANLMGGWCVYFYNRYGKAPKNSIERLYDKWAQKSKDKETISMVEQLLGNLSESYNHKRNHRFDIDHAEEYFNKVRLKRITKEVKNKIEDEDVEEAQKAYNSFHRISLNTAGPIIIGQDWEPVKRAFSKKNLEPIVQWKGPLGKFCGPYFAKNNFICFIAPDKRGKSFWLLDVGYRAWIQGKRVAYFDTGDMTDEQVIRRIGSRCSGLPYRKQKYKFPERLWRNKDDDTARLEFDNRRSRKRLSFKLAKESIERAVEQSRRKVGSFRLHCSPSGTNSVADIKSYLTQWEREDGFVPEVIVIDYADLLAPPSGVSEYRHQINKSWEMMRAMSQEIDCLVVTATQANAASYKSELMGRWNFSEDKRKLAHVTGMIGINATVKEQDRGIQRLNWIVLREGEFSYSKCVHVANCLAISNPAVRSCW